MNLHEEITKLQTATKRGELPRKVRMVKIEELTERYYAETGDLPDAKALERLADLILHEELTDNNEHKVAHNEYPILSETQIARRQEGKHTRKEGLKGEVPLGAADSLGTDGRNHGRPTRRERNTRENRFIDKAAKIRNKERKKAYEEFTKVQPVITRHISELGAN